MRPNTVTSVESDVRLHCQAESEEILDIAYIWTHNGLRIRDTDLIHTRVVSCPEIQITGAASFLLYMFIIVLCLVT
jgi:hypothetical protein